MTFPIPSERRAFPKKRQKEMGILPQKKGKKWTPAKPRLGAKPDPNLDDHQLVKLKQLIKTTKSAVSAYFLALDSIKVGKKLQRRKTARAFYNIKD
jgi:hypothetical protein